MDISRKMIVFYSAYLTFKYLQFINLLQKIIFLFKYIIYELLPLATTVVIWYTHVDNLE